MNNSSIDKKKIESLLPHREPMLLINKLINIIHLKSATALVYVKKTSSSIHPYPTPRIRSKTDERVRRKIDPKKFSGEKYVKNTGTNFENYPYTN